MNLLLALSLAIAAPVPKADDAQKLQAMYGKPANPTAGTACVLTTEGALRVTVPRTEKLFVLDAKKLPPPLVVKQVEGKFQVTVRVTHSPEKTAGNAKGNPTSLIAVSAGISITGTEEPRDNVIFVQRHQKLHPVEDDEWETGIEHYTNYSKGSNGFSIHGRDFDDKPIWLRLTRHYKSVTTETSRDGKKWILQRKHPLDQLGTRVNVSLVAFQSTDADYTVTFDQYEIKPLKDEKK